MITSQCGLDDGSDSSVGDHVPDDRGAVLDHPIQLAT
jgi:hypothetical protein